MDVGARQEEPELQWQQHLQQEASAVVQPLPPVGPQPIGEQLHWPT